LDGKNEQFFGDRAQRYIVRRSEVLRGLRRLLEGRLPAGSSAAHTGARVIGRFAHRHVVVGNVL
jgi:hypothetical protein